MRCADFNSQITKYWIRTELKSFIQRSKMCGKHEMFRFWKLNYKILDKNLTIVLLYREVKCGKTMKCADFES